MAERRKAEEQPVGSIRVAWWNLQNLFDTDDDPISADLDTVANGWTPEVFATKK
jgi:hypothetical protein